jgi:hypothetical protein
VTPGRKKSIVGGGALAAWAAAILFWRNPGSHETQANHAMAARVGVPVARETETRGTTRFGSGVAADPGFSFAVENSSLPLAPSGDYEMAISDSELQAIVEARYGPMVQSLALSPAAGARLFELLIERQHAAIDVANAAMVAGLNPIRDLATIQQAIALAEADVDADIAREHGASVAAACRDFESARAERNTVEQLARAATDLGEPLTPVQQERLISALRDTTAPAPSDINSAIFGRFNRRAQISAQALATAASELSPRQLEALRQLAQATPSERTTTAN